MKNYFGEGNHLVSRFGNDNHMGNYFGGGVIGYLCGSHGLRLLVKVQIYLLKIQELLFKSTHKK